MTPSHIINTLLHILSLVDYIEFKEHLALPSSGRGPETSCMVARDLLLPGHAHQFTVTASTSETSGEPSASQFSAHLLHSHLTLTFSSSHPHTLTYMCNYTHAGCSLALPALPPSPPPPPKVAARGKTSLTLRWNAPIDNGSPITQYCLEWDQVRTYM